MLNLLKHCDKFIKTVTLICFMFVFVSQADTLKEEAKTSSFKEDTFFPVSLGSFWKYVERDAVYPNEVNTEIDSVVSVKDTNNGIVVQILNHMGTGKIHNFRYLINTDGSIYIQIKINAQLKKWYLYGKMNPQIGENVPDPYDTTVIQEYKKVYGSLPIINKKDCLCLEPYSLDTTASDKRDIWYGHIFCKGIGIIFQGGIEDGLDLIQYRIGIRGKVVDLPKPLKKDQ